MPRRIASFRLRTLLLLVTLVGAYIGSWPWCEKRAKHDVRRYTDRRNEYYNEFYIDPALTNLSSPAPFVVQADEGRTLLANGTWHSRNWHRHYYLWCLGLVVEFPYRQEVPSPRGLDPLFGLPDIPELPSVGP